MQVVWCIESEVDKELSPGCVQKMSDKIIAHLSTRDPSALFSLDQWAARKNYLVHTDIQEKKRGFYIGHTEMYIGR